VLLNAAAALYVAGLAPTLAAGRELADAVLRSGRAAELLDRVRAR
jgi:anthranilate phosphoribosyltransferase